MARTILLSFLLLSFLSIQAQTYFYIDEISVSPVSPTTVDPIEISLTGNLSGSGAYVVSASASVVGNTVTIAISAADNGGLTVLVPHTETVPIGMLAAGTYTIAFEAQNVGDFAPAPQHQFTVTAGDPCANLELVSVQWDAFSDTAIVVHVVNNDMGGELFDYPNFILFDTNGDTLAKETVNLFGIGGDSWHVLRVMDDAAVPTTTFNGVLELWTEFTTTLACTWDLPVDLCPPAPCSSMIAYVQNMGGALAIGTYDWSILAADGSVTEGQFEMTANEQMDMDQVCLAPGHYDMNVVANQEPTGGQPVFGITQEGWIGGASQPVYWSLPVLLPFDLFIPCVDTPEQVAEQDPMVGLTVAQFPSGLEVRRSDGTPMGPIAIFDGQGRLLLHRTTSANVANLPLQGIANGMLFIRAAGEALRVQWMGQ
jgi:hypothetical protein